MGIRQSNDTKQVTFTNIDMSSADYNWCIDVLNDFAYTFQCTLPVFTKELSKATTRIQARNTVITYNERTYNCALYNIDNADWSSATSQNLVKSMRFETVDRNTWSVFPWSESSLLSTR